ncbi:TPA: DUF551 domain-containing protein [Escherichia coli]|nr:DUF551 domain-containing protein [Escherichia coli]HAX7055083.1 DUF551 domain-containing protein [Escherichia coli]
MSKIDYQALREKADKATKGSYIVGHTSVNQHGNLTGVFVCQKWKGEPGGVIAECHVNCLVETDAQAYANAEFIAEANPTAVLALLDERERNQQYIKRRDQENEEIALTVGKLRVELEAAEKRIAELEAEPVSQTYKLNELSGNYPVTPDGWISCSERMPAQDDWILIYSKHGEYMAGQVQGEYVELSDGTLSWLGNALYWMPLPEPPQEVK